MDVSQENIQLKYHKLLKKIVLKKLNLNKKKTLKKVEEKPETEENRKA